MKNKRIKTTTNKLTSSYNKVYDITSSSCAILFFDPNLMVASLKSCVGRRSWSAGRNFYYSIFSFIPFLLWVADGKRCFFLVFARGAFIYTTVYRSWYPHVWKLKRMSVYWFNYLKDVFLLFYGLQGFKLFFFCQSKNTNLQNCERKELTVVQKDLPGSVKTLATLFSSANISQYNFWTLPELNKKIN